VPSQLVTARRFDAFFGAPTMRRCCNGFKNSQLNGVDLAIVD